MNAVELFARVLHPAGTARTTDGPRPKLCAQVGCHDPRPDSICRDCGVQVMPGDPVCRREPYGGWGQVG